MSEAGSDGVQKGEPADEIGVPASTLGARLAAERQLRGWTVEQVASQLNLAPRQIQALETDNYAALPGMASVRGFVRAYAKLLKIDASPLVAMIASEQITPTQPLEPKRNLAAAPFSDNRMMSSGHRRSSPKTILVAIVLVLLAIGAIIVERVGGWPALSQSLSAQLRQISAPPDGPGAQSPVAGESANVEASAPSGENAQATLSATSPVNPEINRETSPAAETVKTAADALPVAAKPTDAPASNIAPVESAPDKAPAGTKNLLVLKVRQDSWVEVREGRNALISRLVKGGSTEQVEITEPAALTLGNAAGVDVFFRGSPLEIKADAKNNVVRLSLK